MDTKEAATIIKECAKQREQLEPPMTVSVAIGNAQWVQRTPDGTLSPELTRRTIIALLAALEASPCYLKAVRDGIPSFTLLAYDRAGHAAIQHWADLADDHGARPEKHESARALVAAWQKRSDLRWPT